jgi:ribonuclease D
MERLTNPFKESVTGDDLNLLEYRNFEGRIYVIDTIEKFLDVLPSLRKHKILGFDTETKPSFKKGKIHVVSLMQLSSEHEAFLFRLNKIGLPAELAEILSDQTIIKTGAAIHDDIKLLQVRRKFQPEGFVELQTMVGKYGIKDLGLKKLAAIVLGFKISKRQQVTNWDAHALTDLQIIYAATDAWICYEIYKTLIHNNHLILNKQINHEDSSGVG